MEDGGSKIECILHPPSSISHPLFLNPLPHRGRQHLQRMQRPASRQVLDLMPARRSRRHHRRLRLRWPGPAAAPGWRSSRSGRNALSRSRTSRPCRSSRRPAPVTSSCGTSRSAAAVPPHAEQRLLMTVAVQQALLRPRRQRQVAAARLGLPGQPAVGQLRRRPRLRCVSGPGTSSGHSSASVSRQLGSRPRSGVPSARRRARAGAWAGSASRACVQEALADHAAGRSTSGRPAPRRSRPLQHAHRRPADGRLVERREAIVQQQHPARAGRRTARAGAGRTSGGNGRRAAAAGCGGGRCRPSFSSSQRSGRRRCSQLTSGASGAARRLS